MALTSWMMFLMCCHASSGESCSSAIRRSILLSTNIGVTRSTHACLRTACVWTQTPSTASTSTSALSLSRTAADTSLPKSTWPGESIRLTGTGGGGAHAAAGAAAATSATSADSAAADDDGWKESAMEDDFIVMPRSCSSSRLSMYRSWPASRLEMMPLLAMSESLRVVLPWSTCAITQMLRVVAMYVYCVSETMAKRSWWAASVMWAPGVLAGVFI